MNQPKPWYPADFIQNMNAESLKGFNESITDLKDQLNDLRAQLLTVQNCLNAHLNSFNIYKKSHP